MTRRPDRPYSIIHRLIVSLTLTIGLVSLIATSFFAFTTAKKGAAELEKEADKTISLLTRVLARPLWDFDQKRIAIIGEVYQQDSHILLLTIRENGSKELFSFQRGDLADSIQRSGKVVFDGRIMGDVHIAFDRAHYRERVWQVILIAVAINTLVLLTVFIATGFLIKTFLHRPLSQLTEIVNSYASGDYTAEARTIPIREFQSFGLVLSEMGEKILGQLRNIKTNETRLALALEAANMAWWEWNFKTGDIIYSPHFYTMLGYEPDEFPAHYDEWAKRVHPDDLADAKRKLKKSLVDAKKDIQNLEFRFLTKNGDWRWLSGSGKIVERDAEGNPVRLIGTNLDIAKRKEAEKELIEAKNFSETVINSLPGIFFVYDDNQRLIKWNKNHEVSTGFSAEELSNKHIFDWFSEEDKAKVETELKTVFTTGITNVELNLTIKNGSSVPYFLTGARLDLGERAYIVGFGFNTSDRKKMEEELRQSQKMESIGTLAGGIAHDFNNILAAIFGYTELAELDIDDPDKLSHNIAGVKKAAIRARDLVKQILTFSRKTEEEKQPLQISLIIKEALKLLRSSIPQNIAIEHRIESQSMVLADPTQIHQVMMNLCTNAYHAMRETGGTLAVSLDKVTITNNDIFPELELTPGDYLHLKISDTGCGMEKETVEKIFDPYFTTKEKGEGTGLGLAVVHGIVKNYKGHIKVYSEPGKGTTFNIYLPEVQGEPERYEPTTAQKTIKGGNERIMVVDDEQPIVDIAEQTLTSHGYKVTTFPDGVQALQEFKKHPDRYDLVITDMAMPYMQGSELAQKLLEIRPNIPIILCTGYSEAINKDKTEAMGLKAFIQKPVILSNLLRTTRKVLDMPG